MERERKRTRGLMNMKLLLIIYYNIPSLISGK